MTLDTILAGGDLKVSTLEALARAIGSPVGSLFDEPAPLSVIQTGGQNTVTGDNVAGGDPSLIALVAERDRQVNRLISLLEDALALGKSSANDSDAPANR